jgi:hypothetical protein
MIEDPAATHLPGFKLATAGRILRLASPESVSSSSWQAPAATVAGAGTAAWPALPLAASVPECIMMMAAARDSDSDAPSRSRVARGAGRPGGGERGADRFRRTRNDGLGDNRQSGGDVAPLAVSRVLPGLATAAAAAADHQVLAITPPESASGWVTVPARLSAEQALRVSGPKLRLGTQAGRLDPTGRPARPGGPLCEESGNRTGTTISTGPVAD